MIEQLNKEQEDLLAVYRDKWLRIGLCTDRADWNTAKWISDYYYENIAKKKPVPIVIMPSPLSTWIAVCLLSSDKKQVDSQVWSQVW